MIPLIRNRRPTAVHKNFTGRPKKRFEKELLRNQRGILRGELPKHTFKANRWKVAKKQLIKEVHGKCAYCEAPASMVAFGDVEHYRPKSIYWWLTYSYDNLLLSCELCNEKFKKTKFPVKNKRMAGPKIRRNTTDAVIGPMSGNVGPDPLRQEEVRDFARLHVEERPYLLNPYFDKPTHYYSWSADCVLQEVELAPHQPDPISSRFTRAAEECLGLNRQELKSARFFFYNVFTTLKAAAQEKRISSATRSRIERAVEQMKSDIAPFAGMIRHFDKLP
jgi:uncharacterized protein (TIGR02646 family)